jgi:hypothetical protein
VRAEWPEGHLAFPDDIGQIEGYGKPKRWRDHLKQAICGLTVLAAICGLVGAYYWWKSSKLKWQSSAVIVGRREEVFVGPNAFELFFQKAACMNAKAALWTAGSIFLSACASLLAILA